MRRDSLSKKRLSDEKILSILKGLFEDNKGNTQVAAEVLGKKSKESTVRNIKRVYKKHGNYFGVTLDGVVNTEEDWVVPEQTLESLCEHPDWNVSNLAKRLRSSQKSNNQLRKIHREVFDKEGGLSFEDMLDKLSDNLKGNFVQHYNPVTYKPSQCTLEILFSDWQWGKISEYWDSEVASKASAYYGQELYKLVKEYKPERIVFSALGDNIECMLKHGIQSAKSTDTSNAEQMSNCIKDVWQNILQPLFSWGIPVDFVGVVGNHGSSEGKGMDMFKAGRYSYDYTLYKTWEMLCETGGYTHVNFILPEGHFATYDIYGKLTVAEHGYNCKGSSESALIALRNKRATNLQEYVHRVVVGDMHHYCNYDNGNLQVNGAAFGVAFDAIEYSGIMGFHAIPAQIVNIHEPCNGVGQNTVVETKVIQIAKGYNYE